MASLTREEVHTRLSSVVFAPYVQYLEENQTLIMAIIENQNLGKFPECAQYVSMPGPLSLLQCCASLYMCACVCVCVCERESAFSLAAAVHLSLSLCVCVCCSVRTPKPNNISCTCISHRILVPLPVRYSLSASVVAHTGIRPGCNRTSCILPQSQTRSHSPAIRQETQADDDECFIRPCKM